MRRLRFFTLTILVIIFGSSSALAQTSKSTNYQVNEVEFGSGGLLNGSSTNYKAQENLGSTTVGSTKSTNYGAYTGFLTPNVPFLSMTVSAANVNLGTLSSSSAATGTSTFSVRAYVDSGYVVESVSPPPTNEDGYSLKNMSTAAASTVGTEQFGINLVQNQTSCATPAPANFGTNPVEVPSSAYSTGSASSGYNTCGLFKYNAGDVIAQSNSNGWGETDYTISYLINIAQYSKAGVYSMPQNLVVVATY
jgi:hypothetical protein